MSGNDHEMASMEEGFGETSGGSDQIIMKGKELSNNAKENLKVLDNFLANEQFEGDHHQEPTTKPSIPKIPSVLRHNQNFTKYFEPRMVSIGPYHHEDHNLKVTHEMKLKIAAMFIKEYGMNKEDLYLCILMQVENLRRCYEKNAIQQYNDDDLAWMFLIDGCVVLYFILVRDQALTNAENMFHRLEILKSKGFESFQDETEFKNFSTELLLLENQLPYQVLNLLINSSSGNSLMLKKSIQKFINTLTFSGLEREPQRLPVEDPAHLLDQMRRAFLIQSVEKKSSFMRMLEKYSNKIRDMLSGMLSFLILALLLIIPDSNSKHLISFHNIVELKEAGVNIKSSGACNFTDISFSRGTLKLPSLVVNKATMFKFLNLVGYEMGLNFSKLQVSSYIYFLTSLIARVEDVKELCKNKILNFVDSDEEIVEIFQELRTNGMAGPFDQNFGDIMHEIHEHCGKRHNAWMAQLKNNYFESPWSVIALVGAFTAVALTMLQTVYSLLGYYRSCV